MVNNGWILSHLDRLDIENEKKKRHAGVSKRGEILRPKDV